MRFLARATGPTDDEEDDSHLITFESGDHGSQLVFVADQEEIEEFAAEISGVEAPDRERDVDLYSTPEAAGCGENASSADDATEDVAEDLDAITAANAVTSDNEDAVTNDHGLESDSPTATEL